MSADVVALRVSPATLIDAPDDLDAINKLYRDKRWGDGLPIVPPTEARVARILAALPQRPRDVVVASLAPAFNAATVERIAINAVMAGCEPALMAPLVAAVEAIAATEFNLQALQATTNPVAVWIVVNGPASAELGVNGTYNCLGEGAWANATLGRALRLILRNVGGALPGDLRAEIGCPDVRQLVVAAIAAVDDLLAGGRDESLPLKPVERGVQGADFELDAPIGQPCGILDDSVAVLATLCQRGQHEERWLSHLLCAHAEIIVRLSIYIHECP